VDGVYIGRALGSVMGILDISQVEVLRGPQGTLFGKNATGGAVTIRTTRPNDDFSAWAEVTAGSDNRGDLRFVVNAPLTDQLLTRFSASSLNRDGYGASLQDGTEFGDVNTDHVRGALRWLPRENLTVDLIADFTRSHQGSAVTTLLFAEPGPDSLTGAYNFFVAPTNEVPGFGTGVPWDSRFITDEYFTNYSTAESGSELDTYGLTAIVNWSRGDLELKSITGYRTMDSWWGLDADLSPLTIVEDIQETEQRQFSQEFNLRGAGASLDWLLGLYYFEEEAVVSGGVILIPEVFTVPSDPVYGIPNPLYERPFGGLRSKFNTTGASSLAGFAHLDCAFTERLSGALGARYTVEEKRTRNPPGAVPVASNGDSETFENFSPMASMQYFIDRNMQIYGSVSQGFKSGGFNTLVVHPIDQYQLFDPEEVTSYELGLKVSRERFNLAGSIFVVNYDEIHTSVLDDTVPKILNVAEAEIRGFELELVAAITSSLRAQAGIGYLDAEYTKLNPRGLQDLTIPVTLDSSFMNAPEWSFNLGLDYSRQIQSGRFEFRADYAWQDKIFNDAINTEELVQGAFGLLHARVSLGSNSGHWQFSLFGNNLTNEKYIQSGLADKTDMGGAVANYARPRQWGFSVRYRF
jgi:iron complex outermembrane receptor protein